MRRFSRLIGVVAVLGLLLVLDRGGRKGSVALGCDLAALEFLNIFVLGPDSLERLLIASRLVEDDDVASRQRGGVALRSARELCLCNKYV